MSSVVLGDFLIIFSSLISVSLIDVNASGSQMHWKLMYSLPTLTQVV